MDSKTYIYDPANKFAAEAVRKMEAAKPIPGGMVYLSKDEMKVWINDVTVINTTIKPLIHSMNDLRRWY